MKNSGKLIAIAGAACIVGALTDIVPFKNLILIALGLGALGGGTLRQAKLYIDQNNKNNENNENNENNNK